jgi:tetratricopeptide (TPR) repeat protein
MSDEYDLIAAFDMSYRQLSNDEQRYWRTLSVFPISFEQMAAINIWEVEEKEAKRLLGVFKRYSLVEFNESIFRYRLHELLREFAASKIQNSELKLSKYRHAIFYSKVCIQIAHYHFSGEENYINALHMLDFEWENIYSGFLFASSKNTPPCLSATSLYAAPSDILKLRLHPLDMIKWLSLAVSAARKINDMEALSGHLSGLGTAYLEIGKIDKSIECHMKALDIAEKITDQFTRDSLMSIALGNMGQSYEHKGDFKSAEKCYETALSLSRKLKNPYSEAMDLLNIGSVKTKIGENELAIESILKAKEIFDEFGFLGKVGACLTALGNVYTRDKKLDLALEHLERARKICVEMGDTQNFGVCLQNIGNVYMELERYDVALNYFNEAMEVATLSNDLIGTAQRIANIGTALCKSGKQRESLPYFEQAISISKDIGADELTFVTVRNLVTVYAELDENQKIEEVLSSALFMFPEGSDYLRKIKSLQRYSRLLSGRTWEELNGLEQALWIVGQVKSNLNTSDTKEAYRFVSQMISNIKAPLEFQELGRVLKKYMDGEKEIDLSKIPNEFAHVVRSEFDTNDDKT